MDSNVQIIQIGAECDYYDYIWQIAEMTHEFAHESHIYERLGFNKDKFYNYVVEHSQAPASVYAAVRDGEVLGYTIFFLDTFYVDHINFEIITIFVPKKHRKTKVGRMLTEALVDTMDLNDCKYGQISVCCAMKEDEEIINRLTENMFKKHGFYQIGTILGRKGASWDS